MTLCGQAKLHCPHWMHRFGSQIATLSEILRFSKAALPDGQVPSAGSWLTRMSSPPPSPRIILAVTSCTNAGACAGTIGGRSNALVAEAGAIQSKADQAGSFAGRIGHTLAPAFEPLGFDWQLTVGVLTSFLAREVFVSTMSVLAGGQGDGNLDEGVVARIRGMTRDDGTPVFSAATAASALVFFVLAMQCLPTLAVTRKETGKLRYAALQLGYMSGLAYIVALAVYQGLRAAGVA